MSSLLEVEGLETAYGRSQVLFGVDLSVREGEAVGLMGRNGMGKTTTIRSIMSLTPATRGRVRINGVEFQGRPTYLVARAGLAIVPEGRQVFSKLTVLEHLLMATNKRGHRDDNPESAGKRCEPWTVKKVFELFPRLAERRENLGGQLSGGEQQMLAIGRALMTNPQLILFDEATEGLAPLVRQEIWSAILALKARGTAILIVDKNVADVAQVVERLYVLEKGMLAWSGDPAVLDGSAELKQRYMGL